MPERTHRRYRLSRLMVFDAMDTIRPRMGERANYAKEHVRVWLENRTRSHSPTRRVRFRLAVRALEAFSDGQPVHLLDAGTSDGLIAEGLGRRYPQWSIDAVDVDSDALGLAEQRIRVLGIENVRLRYADVEEELGDQVYDAVLALECLAFVGNDDAALRSMANALRNGGLFLAHVQKRDWKPILKRAMSIWPGQNRSGYTPHEIISKLEKAGLSLDSLVPTSRGLAVVGRELIEHKELSLKKRLAWTPIAMMIARLDQAGLTWGEPRGYFVIARRQS